MYFESNNLIINVKFFIHFFIHFKYFLIILIFVFRLSAAWMRSEKYHIFVCNFMWNLNIKLCLMFTGNNRTKNGNKWKEKNNAWRVSKCTKLCVSAYFTLRINLFSRIYFTIVHIFFFYFVHCDTVKFEQEVFRFCQIIVQIMNFVKETPWKQNAFVLFSGYASMKRVLFTKSMARWRQTVHFLCSLSHKESARQLSSFILSLLPLKINNRIYFHLALVGQYFSIPFSKKVKRIHFRSFVVVVYKK